MAIPSATHEAVVDRLPLVWVLATGGTISGKSAMDFLPIIWCLAGLLAGASFVALARSLGERHIVALGLVIAALIYVGFATFGGASPGWIGIELMGTVLFGGFAVLGFAYTRWWLVLGWGAHPVWDVALHLLGDGNAFAPHWYAVLCISFDVVVAGYVAFQCWHRSGSNNSPKPTPLSGVV